MCGAWGAGRGAWDVLKTGKTELTAVVAPWPEVPVDGGGQCGHADHLQVISPLLEVISHPDCTYKVTITLFTGLMMKVRGMGGILSKLTKTLAFSKPSFTGKKSSVYNCTRLIRCFIWLYLRKSARVSSGSRGSTRWRKRSRACFVGRMANSLLMKYPDTTLVF